MGATPGGQNEGEQEKKKEKKSKKQKTRKKEEETKASDERSCEPVVGRRPYFFVIRSSELRARPCNQVSALEKRQMWDKSM